MKAALIISHGSRSQRTKEEIQILIQKLLTKSSIPIIRGAFLEIESPSISEGITECIERGANEIIILMNFLNSGRHVDVDIPLIIQEARIKYPDIKIYLTSPIGQHPGIPNLFNQILGSLTDSHS